MEHKDPYMDPSPSQVNKVHTLSLYCYKILNNIFPYMHRLPNGLFPSDFPTKLYAFYTSSLCAT